MIRRQPRPSKAIPIVNPDTGKPPPPPPSLTSPLSPAHEAALQEVGLAVAALHLPTASSHPGQHSTTAPAHSDNKSDSKNTAATTAAAPDRPSTSASTGTSTSTSAPAHHNADDQLAFNIYARPFIPSNLLVINTLPGRNLHTCPRKCIDFNGYVVQSFGPAAASLPVPPPVFSAPLNLPHSGTKNLVSYRYEAYFRLHLAQEADAEQKDYEDHSLYGHDAVIEPANASREPAEALVSLQVPGLRENSPPVEVDDVIELRQLQYGADGNLVQMSPWLAMRDAFQATQTTAAAWTDAFREAPAPGWTNTIYYSRVLNIVRSSDTLTLRVLGLAASAGRVSAKFNVRFLPPVDQNMPLFYALHEAQQKVLQGGWFHSMLFPTKQDCDIQEHLHPGVFGQTHFDRELNWEQKKAVESVCRRNYGELPFLISGPPGTGKTKTIIEIALQLAKNKDDAKHVILCAPSDPAADILCQRLGGHLKPGELLRLMRPSRTFAEVPGNVLPYSFIENDEFQLPPFLQLMRYRVVVTTCRDASILARARVSNTDLFALEQGAQAVSMTLHPFDQLPKPKLHWSALLIDEAAQASEPEALIPLTIVSPPTDEYSGSSPQVVMAGDEYQLGPKTSLPSTPLKQSLFARLFKQPVYADHPLARGKQGQAPPPLTRSLLPVFRPAFCNLIRNYRSHPAILAVPSHQFYWDTLEPEAENTERLETWPGWRGRGWPVLFHDHDSRDDIDPRGLLSGSGGWYNEGEADIACRYARAIVATGLMEPQDVCIMSPFKAQVRHLRTVIRKRFAAGWDVNIGPTEAFQGLESGVVILCTTRSRDKFVEQDKKLDWGIIGTPNKMNVALTRAKCGLIVLGRRKLLAEDPNWKAFLDFCDRNGLVAGDGPREEGVKAGHVDETSTGATRLEKILVGRDRAYMQAPPGARSWGVMNGVEPGMEMWTSGMVETPGYEEDYWGPDEGYNA